MGKGQTRIVKRNDDDEDEQDDSPKLKKGQTGIKGATAMRYKERQEKAAFSGYIKMLFFLAFLGVVIGLGVVYYPTIMNMLNPPKPVAKLPPPKIEEPKLPPPKIEAPPPPEIKAPPKVEIAAPPPKVEKKPEREVVDAEDKKALTLIADGQKSMAAFKFVDAKKKFADAALLKASLENHNTAETLAKKAQEFDLGTKHIAVSEYAKADVTHKLTLDTGDVWIGIKLGEDDENVNFQKISGGNPASTGSIKTPLPKSSITSLVEVKLADRQAEFRDMLSKLEGGLSGGGESVSDFYDLIYLSRRLSMNAECLGYLNKAYEKSPEGKLGDDLRKVVINRAIDKATVMALAKRRQPAEITLSDMLRTLDNWDVAQNEVKEFKDKILSQIKDDFKPTMQITKTKPKPAEKAKQSAKQMATSAASGKDEGEDMFVIDSSGVKGNGANQSVVDEANKKYDEGMGFYAKYQQGTSGNNNANLEKALHLLEAAVDLYGKVLDKEPNNNGVANRQQEASMIAYACRKYHTL